MTDIDEIMCKPSDHYRFHGVRGATLARLIQQAAQEELVLWGRVEDEEGNAGYEWGRGELSVTGIRDLEMSCNEFCDESGLVLILEKRVTDPCEQCHPTNPSEHLVQVQEWKVVGGLRPIFDEDGDLIDQQAFSLAEILGG